MDDGTSVIRFVFFDVGGVLKIGLQETKNDFAERAGIPVEEFREYQRSHFDLIERGTLSKSDFFRQLDRDMHLGRTDLEQIWDQSFLRDYHVFSDVLDWSMELKKRFSVGIISNVSPLSKGLIESKGLYQPFRPLVFLSCEIGLLKPHREIFDYVNMHTKTRPDECVLIDDTSLIVEAAQSYGWNAIHHRHLDETKKKFEKLLVAKNIIP